MSMSTPTRHRRLAATLVASLAMTSFLLPIQHASARDDGGAIAAGVIGGLALGAIAGGAARPAPPPVVYESRPVRVAPPVEYEDEEECRIRRERFWDGYEWRVRRVRVCN